MKRGVLMKVDKRNSGFTLVELIIVIAILAVLVGVIAPQYLKYVERTKRVVDVSTAREIADAFERVFAIDNPDMRVGGKYYTAVAWGKDSRMPTYETATDFLDYIFLELGEVPKSKTFKNFLWIIDYDVNYGFVETVKLLNFDTGKSYQLYPTVDETFLK